MDYPILSRAVGALVTVALMVLLFRRMGKQSQERRAALPVEGAVSCGLPPALWRFFLVAALILLALVGMLGFIGPALTGGDPLDQLPAKLGFLAAAALSALASAHYRTWRLTADGEGLHLRRLLLPSLDVPWGRLDSFAFSNDGQGAYIVSDGRKRASFPVVYLAYGDGSARLGEVVRSHGVPTELERDLPEGVPGPHGLERRQSFDDRMRALPVWEQLLLALAFILVFSVVFFLIVVLLMG